MSADLSVIIPTRNEPMLGYTLRRLFASRQGAKLDVIVIRDGTRQEVDVEPAPGCSLRVIDVEPAVGNCYCRDVGIEAARADACLILDAHMNFRDDDGWPQKCFDHAAFFPRHIGCAISVQLDSDPRNSIDEQMDMDTRREWDVDTPDGSRLRPRSAYKGAGLLLYQYSERTRRHTIFPSKWTTPGKWAPDAETRLAGGQWVEVQSVLGGAYVLSRDWYMTGLNRPWRHNRGWGTSEQSISIPNWLCGGRNVVLPIEIGHQYRTNEFQRVPYRTNIADIYWNQIRLAHALPIPEKLRFWLTGKVHENRGNPAIARLLARYALEMPPSVDGEWLAGAAVRTWAEYVEAWQVEIPEDAK